MEIIDVKIDPAAARSGVINVSDTQLEDGALDVGDRAVLRDEGGFAHAGVVLAVDPGPFGNDYLIRFVPMPTIGCDLALFNSAGFGTVRVYDPGLLAAGDFVAVSDRDADTLVAVVTDVNRRNVSMQVLWGSVLHTA